MMPDDYDWRVDAYQCWLEALAAIHARLVAEGKVAPRGNAPIRGIFPICDLTAEMAGR